MNLKRKLELEQEKLVLVTVPKEKRKCSNCRTEFEPATDKQRHCSNECWMKENGITN